MRWLTNTHETRADECVAALTEGQPARRLSVGLPNWTDEYDQLTLNAMGMVGIYEWIDTDGRHLGYGDELLQPNDRFKPASDMHQI